MVLPDRSVSGLAPVVDFCEKYDERFGSIEAKNCLKDLSQDWHRW
jgi:hypothetical protein